MNKSIIIHKSSYGTGGLGDFTRAAISFYSFCVRNNLEYYIDFSENPNLSKCFYVQNIPESIKTLPCLSLNLIGGICDYESIKDILDKILTIPKVYYIKSNYLGFEDIKYISNVRDSFFSSVLKPSEIILEKINEIYKNNHIEPYKYISFHIRCGDYNIPNFLVSKRNEGQNYNQHKYLSNIRIDLENQNIYVLYQSYIEKLKKEYNITVPFIIHSDSLIFKENMKNLYPQHLYLDIDIQHTSDCIGNNTPESFISTISEFYIMTKSSKIFVLLIEGINNPNTAQSGFSLTASLVENTPLYTNNKTYPSYSLLNCGQINYI
jgi:hypothetical protein